MANKNLGHLDIFRYLGWGSTNFGLRLHWELGLRLVKDITIFNFRIVNFSLVVLSDGRKCDYNENVKESELVGSIVKSIFGF